MSIFTIALATSAALAALLLFLLRSLRFRAVEPESQGWSEEWFNGFSVDYYKPMKRLLLESDFEYLRKQPGYTKQIEQRLRRERADAFKAYLRSLSHDFSMLYSGLNTLLLESETDRSDLAAGLVTLRAEFAWRRTQAYFRLQLFRYGVRPVTLVPLFAPVEALRSRVQLLAPMPLAF